MKKLLIITDIKISLEESEYVIPMMHADMPDLVRYDLHSLLAVRGHLTGKLQVLEVEASYITYAIAANQKQSTVDRTYADYLYSQQPDNDNIVVTVDGIDYPQTAYIVMSSNEYIEDYQELYDHDEEAIIYNLLLDYCQLAVNHHIE